MPPDHLSPRVKGSEVEGPALSYLPVIAVETTLRTGQPPLAIKWIHPFTIPSDAGPAITLKNFALDRAAPGPRTLPRVPDTFSIYPFLSFNRQGDRVATTETQRSYAAMHILPHHLVDQRRQHTRAARANGMADRDCAAIHVYPCQI